MKPKKMNSSPILVDSANGKSVRLSYLLKHFEQGIVGLAPRWFCSSAQEVSMGDNCFNMAASLLPNDSLTQSDGYSPGWHLGQVFRVPDELVLDQSYCDQSKRTTVSKAPQLRDRLSLVDEELGLTIDGSFRKIGFVTSVNKLSKQNISGEVRKFRNTISLDVQNFELVKDEFYPLSGLMLSDASDNPAAMIVGQSRGNLILSSFDSIFLANEVNFLSEIDIASHNNNTSSSKDAINPVDNYDYSRVNPESSLAQVVAIGDRRRA